MPTKGLFGHLFFIQGACSRTQCKCSSATGPGTQSAKLNPVGEDEKSLSLRKRAVTHLSEQQLSGYANRTLSGSDVLAADDHLTECLTCCKSLRSVLQANTGGSWAVNSTTLELTTQSEDFHLSFEQISAFVELQLDAVDREIITSHLAFCPNCLAEIDDLRVFKQVLAKQINFQPTPAPVPRAWWEKMRSWPARWVLVPLTAGLCLGTISLVFTWRQQPESIARQKTIAPSQAAAPAPTEVFAPSPGPRTTPEKTIVPASPEERAIQLALVTGRVEVTAEIKTLRLRGASLMGASGEKPSFAVLSPQGTLVADVQPHLLWTPLAQAKSYVVAITDQNFKEVAHSSPLRQVSWTVPVKLARGHVYQWQVTATTEAGKEITAPVPSAPEAKFKVLTNESVSLLQRVRARYAGAHLELGISYARAGLLDEAAREFRLEKTRGQLAHRLLNSLSQQRR